MAGRRGELPKEAQRLIGHAVAVARENQLPWKVLERVYDRDRSQLWRYANAVRQELGARCNTLTQDATSAGLYPSRILLSVKA